MAQNIFVIFAGVASLAVRNDSMHSKLCVLTLFDKVRSHRRCHHVGHIGLPLRQVSREIHLLPSVLFLEQLHPRKPEVLANALALHKVY